MVGFGVLGTKLTVWILEFGELFVDAEELLGWGRFSAKVADSTVEFARLAPEVVVAAATLVDSAEFSTNVTVSATGFEGLFASVTVGVLGLTGLSLDVTVSLVEFAGLSAEVAVAAVVGLEGFSTKVTVSALGGVGPKVIVLMLGFDSVL